MSPPFKSTGEGDPAAALQTLTQTAAACLACIGVCNCDPDPLWHAPLCFLFLNIQLLHASPFGLAACGKAMLFVWKEPIDPSESTDLLLIFAFAHHTLLWCASSDHVCVEDGMDALKELTMS